MHDHPANRSAVQEARMRWPRRSLFLVLYSLLALGIFAKAPTLVTPPPPNQPAEDRHADHEELRAMLRTATDALNKRDADALSPLLGAHCYITTVDGQTFRDAAGFKAYLDRLYGSSVTKIEFHPVADELTTFLGSDSGICVGSSNDTYTFKDGSNRAMTSRWTATVHKEDGKWKMVGLHTSANILDNPVVDATKKKGYATSGAAIVIGAIVGYALRAATKRT
jgi:ketosteroid isomerase-like protein